MLGFGSLGEFSLGDTETSTGIPSFDAINSIGNITASATAVVINNATVNASIGDITSSSAAEVPNPVSVNTSIGNITASATAVVINNAAVSTSIGNITLQSAVTSGPIGVVNASIGNITSSATAAVEVHAALSASIGNITSVSAAQVVVSPIVATSIGNVTSSATATVTSHATVNTSIGNITSSATATVTPHAAASISIGNITLVAALHNPVTAGLVNGSTGVITGRGRMQVFYAWPNIRNPDFPVPKKRTPAVDTVGYGPYSERRGNGIFSKKIREVPMTWSLLTNSEKEQFDTFLKGRGGAGRFLFTEPGEDEEMQYSCPKWRFVLTNPGRWRLEATFNRRFDPTQG